MTLRKERENKSNRFRKYRTVKTSHNALIVEISPTYKTNTIIEKLRYFKFEINLKNVENLYAKFWVEFFKTALPQ